MVQFSYIIVCSDEVNARETLSLLNNFADFYCVAMVTEKEKAVDAILEHSPHIVFLDIESKAKTGLPLYIMTELHQYVNQLPAFIVTAQDESLAYTSLKAGVFDYLLKPLHVTALRKSLLRYQKLWSAIHHTYVDKSGEILPEDDEDEIPEDDEKAVAETQKSEVDIQICIKSYGDYQFIALKDVVYLEADNNTTDFYLVTGKKLSAYKTLKHYEKNLPSFFYRIHNSYIVNSSYVSRINTGKQLCYLNNNEISVSFSKTFKDNIDTIIRTIAPEYL